MGYWVAPNGLVSHKTVLTAQGTEGIPSGVQIEWFKNGVLLKSGLTSDSSMLSINTGSTSDVNFTAEDTGAQVYFAIGTVPDLSTYSVLTNRAPVLSNAGPQTDGYARTGSSPTITFRYQDADSDPCFYYQIKIGTAATLSDIWDSGRIYPPSSDGADKTYDVAVPVTLPDGYVFHWSVELTDGEKADPFDPSDDPSRVMQTSSGTGQVNNPPIVDIVYVDGVATTWPAPGPNISNNRPVISWGYQDVDGQPQQKFRIRISTISTFPSDQSGLIWDSGIFPSSSSSCVYNFNRTASVSRLPSHTNLYINVQVWDTYTNSINNISTFRSSVKPKILMATVDGQEATIKPAYINNLAPLFTWDYEDSDIVNGEEDPLSGYEIRVSKSNSNWGTDTFDMEVWHSGHVTRPDSYQARMYDNLGTSECMLCPEGIQPGILYYFQVKVWDSDSLESDWYSGAFQINNPPIADNVRIVPSNPYPLDTLEAFYDFTDDIGETESDKTKIIWFKGTSPTGTFYPMIELNNQKVVPSNYLAPRQYWYFVVIPHDGKEFGQAVASSAVQILNNIPQAVVSGIKPPFPKTSDKLEAEYSLSDSDNHTVTASVRWYKKSASETVFSEVLTLRNSDVVPPESTTFADQWFFTVEPFDGYDKGARVQSPTVTVVNTPPEILGMTVDGQISPIRLKCPNPTIAWVYSDDDNHAQKSYQIAIGTVPIRTKSGVRVEDAVFQCGSFGNGIVSIARSDGEIIAGNELFDTGTVRLDASSFQYITSDYVPPVSMDHTNEQSLSSYVYNEGDGRYDLNISGGNDNGRVYYEFVGLSGLYQIQADIYGDSKKTSSYTLHVGGVKIDQFNSKISEKRYFKPVLISPGDIIALEGTSIDKGARASFVRLVAYALLEFEIKASQFDNLIGYEAKEDGTIALAGASGSATTRFKYPSGTYDIEVFYVTEDSGTPSLDIFVGGTSVLSFTYEIGKRVRSKVIKNATISSGGTIKISGVRSGGALARVQSISFRPVETIQTGASLQRGFTYFASVRVNDGYDWSYWYTTRFTMEGSAWASVSNSRGWTIEARLALVPRSQTNGE